jgi:hypothetical protein
MNRQYIIKETELPVQGTQRPVILKTEKWDTIILGKVLYECHVQLGKNIYLALGRTAQEAQREAISSAERRRTPAYTIP